MFVPFVWRLKQCYLCAPYFFIVNNLVAVSLSKIFIEKSEMNAQNKVSGYKFLELKSRIMLIAIKKYY